MKTIMMLKFLIKPIQKMCIISALHTHIKQFTLSELFHKIKIPFFPHIKTIWDTETNRNKDMFHSKEKIVPIYEYQNVQLLNTLKAEVLRWDLVEFWESGPDLTLQGEVGNNMQCQRYVRGRKQGTSAYTACMEHFRSTEFFHVNAQSQIYCLGSTVLTRTLHTCPLCFPPHPYRPCVLPLPEGSRGSSLLSLTLSLPS